MGHLNPPARTPLFESFMLHITLTILGLQPEQANAAKNTAPRQPLPQTAWQWPKPTLKQAAPKIGFMDHWQVPAHASAKNTTGAPRNAAPDGLQNDPSARQPAHIIAKALHHGRLSAANYPAPSTCVDDPEARLLARFAPTASAHETAKLALLADLATDTTLKEALSQYPDLVSISRLEPVHLQAGTDHAVVMGARYLNLSAEEWQSLACDLNQWLKPDGLTLITAASGRHYLGYTAAAADRMGARDLPPLGCALNRNAQPLLAGDALCGMRRWLTEAQMWLYAHPLNLRRAEQGRPELNSLWVWGRSHYDAEKLTGLLSSAPILAASPTGTRLARTPPPPLIYTDSAVLAGALITATGAPRVCLARNATPQWNELPERVLTGEQPLHLIWSEPAWCYFEGDIEGWQRSLDAIENFVQVLSMHNQTKPRISLDDGLSQQWHPARTGIMGLWSRFW
jgi:hypothetical protein